MSVGCDAARAGAFVASVSKLPLAKFRLNFMGTGSAELPSDQLSDLAKRDTESRGVEMRWTRNRFLGEHWLFGKVSIELDETRESNGTISDFRQESGRTIAYNINRFYFRFRSSRFPRITLRTVEPVVNAAQIDAIPPIGSKFDLVESGPIALTRQSYGATANKFGTLDFDFCEVTAFPKRNVSISVEHIEYSGLVAKITVRLANLTAEKVRATFFVVDHSKALTPDGDAVFFDLSAGSSRVHEFTVASTVGDHDEVLPLFAGIYKPERLQGSAETELALSYQ